MNKQIELVPTGYLIGEYLEERGIPQKDLANAAHVAQSHISNLINGRTKLTARMALILEELMQDVPASYWINYEAKYQEEKARREGIHKVGRPKGSGLGERRAKESGSNRYVRYLSESRGAASADMETFTLYMRGQIDIDECFNQWWLNNKPKLVRSEFAAWVKSMGYDPKGYAPGDEDYLDDSDDEWDS